MSKWFVSCGYEAVDPRYFGDFLFLTIYFATLHLFITFNYHIKQSS